MNPTNRHLASDRRPMDSETVIGLVLLVIGLLAFGDFGQMILRGMFSLAGH